MNSIFLFFPPPPQDVCHDSTAQSLAISVSAGLFSYKYFSVHTLPRVHLGVLRCGVQRGSVICLLVHSARARAVVKEYTCIMVDLILAR